MQLKLNTPYLIIKVTPFVTYTQLEQISREIACLLLFFYFFAYSFYF